MGPGTEHARRLPSRVPRSVCTHGGRASSSPATVDGSCYRLLRVFSGVAFDASQVSQSCVRGGGVRV